MTALNRLLSPARRALALLGVAAGLCLLLGWLAYRIVLGVALVHEHGQAAQRLDGFALSLAATLARHEALPGLLALHPSLLEVLRHPDDAQRVADANAYLEAAQQGAAVSVAYLIGADGVTLAASNWRLPLSFVGHNYAFRPYFVDALAGGLGRFYGVGVTTGEPGYFIAGPVRDGSRVLGVLVLKVSLDSIEQALAGAGDMLLVDADGIVFLAAERRLRYRALAPLDAAATARNAQTRQYGSQAPPLLADRALPSETVWPLRFALADESARERQIQSRPVGTLGWQVVQLRDTTEMRATALAAGNAVAFATAFLLGLAAYFRQRSRRRDELRKIYDELESRIAERTADLTDKIAALEGTEAILRETRDAAVQAGKLATLGQMAAGISHELNQPLAALQTFADNARALLERGRLGEAADNLQTIGELVARAGRIVRQLKAFARKEAPTPVAVPVASAIEHVLTILEPRRRELAARIVVGELAPGLAVIAEAGRLEQVLVNLLRNGLDAMQDFPAPCLDLDARRVGDRVILQVRDRGAGLGDEALGHLFEAFYTTKPVGEGLGLGLAISRTIVESYGGTLGAHNAPDGGAVFVIDLPAAGDDHAAPDA